MENTQLPFDNWKSRCHCLGNLMTNLPEFSEKNRAKLEAYNIRFNDVSARPLTDSQKAERLELIEKAKLIDELPTGAKTHLDSVYSEVIDERRQIIDTDAMGKGASEEQDALDLLSKYDRAFYIKNKEPLENEWLVGTPDNIQGIVRDTKCSFDYFSFQNTKSICNNYKWQIKAYAYLSELTEGVVASCLVNTPAKIINKLKYNLFFKLGAPSENDEDLYAYKKYLEGAKQIERAHICDIEKFLQDLPSSNEFFEFHNDIESWTFDIHIALRVKKFPVSLEPGDVEHIIRRIKMAREYLNNKYLEERKTISDWENNVKL